MRSTIAGCDYFSNYSGLSEIREVSTLVNNAPSDTLWFWPKAGGDNAAVPQYNDTPDKSAGGSRFHFVLGQEF